MKLNSKYLVPLLVAAIFSASPASNWIAALSFDATGADAVAARKKKTRDTPALREATYKKLAEAQEKMEVKDYPGAMQILRDAETNRSMNEYEQAQILNLMGNVYYLMDNSNQAIKSYERLLQVGGEKIPEGLETSTLWNLFQLNFVADNYSGARKWLNQWFDVAENPGPEAYLALAQIYYQEKKYRDAVSPIEKAMSIARERGQRPQESWWNLLYACYYQVENWPKVLETLEVLIQDYPKRDYWIQYAGVLATTNKEKKALNAMQVARAQGYLEREGECLNIVGLTMQADAPALAARYLEDCIKKKIVTSNDKNYQTLGQAYQAVGSADRSIEAYSKGAGSAPNGEMFYRLSVLYLDKDDNKNCIESAGNALKRGGLREPSDARMVKGMCEYALHEYASAEESFRSALQGADGSQERIIRQWISHVASERERQRVLDAAI